VEDAVYLGRVTVYNVGDPDTFSVTVAEGPFETAPPFMPPFEPMGRFVTVPCESPSRTYSCEGTNCHAACGGTFTFNTTSGSCIPDRPVPPWVMGVYAVTSTEIELWFTTPLSEETAEDLSNYGVEGPAPPPVIMSASLVGDGRCVLLTISPGLVRGGAYSFYVKDVEDLEGNRLPKGGRKGLWYDLGVGIDPVMAHPYRVECRTMEVVLRYGNSGWLHSNGFCVDLSTSTGGPFTSMGCVFRCDTLPARTAAAETLLIEIPVGWPGFDLLKFTLNSCGGIKDIPKEQKYYRDYFQEVPRITSIVDTPNDHGRSVTMSFRGIWEVGRFPYSVIRYDVYRYGPPWEVVAAVPAQHISGVATYQVNVPTLFDCVPPTSITYTTYSVRAVTADPEGEQYYESCPDSGYSFDNMPIGTQVQSFAASADRTGGGIRLSWTLASADAALEYYIARAEEGAAAFIDLAAPRIDSDGLSFSCVDAGVESGTSYRYRVGYVESAQRKLLFETEAVAAPTMPLVLYQNSPNPFNPVTTIRYNLPAAGFVRLGVYDVAGKEVARLVEGGQGAGLHTIEWKGCDGGGRPAASGVYFCRITFGKESINRKMILLR